MVDTVILEVVTTTGRFTEEIVERLAPGNLRTYSYSRMIADTDDGGRTTAVIIRSVRDEIAANDTTFLLFQRPQSVPFFEDFNNNRLPEGWDLPEEAEVAVDPQTESPAIIVNSIGGRNTSFRTAFYEATYEEGDSLRFTVNVIDNPSDSPILLSITSIGCEFGNSIFRTDSLETREYAIALDSIEPEFIGIFQFGLVGQATVSFDNINIARCPGTLSLGTDIVPTTSRTASNATATVLPNAGTPPYTYRWSTGETTQTITGLALGSYTVTVTDRLGCRDSRVVTILNFVDTEDPEGVLAKLQAFPNPTDGLVNLTVDLPAAEALSLEIYEATGRRVRTASFGRLRSLTTTVDLSDLAPGLYLLRVQAGGAARTLRVLRH